MFSLLLYIFVFLIIPLIILSHKDQVKGDYVAVITVFFLGHSFGLFFAFLAFAAADILGFILLFLIMAAPYFMVLYPVKKKTEENTKPQDESLNPEMENDS